MANTYFRFKQFTVHQELSAMKVTTDACLFGAWAANDLRDQSLNRSMNLLDAGTGTGLLSLMIAQQTPLQIDAIEIDQQAAAEARANFDLSPWKDRLQVIHGDLRESISPSGYDHIVSNPPFYENELSANDSRKNIAHHGEGLLLTELISCISKAAKEESGVYILYPARRVGQLTTALRSAGFFIHRLCEVKQSVNHGVFRVMIKAGRAQKDILHEEIAIRDAENNYTDVFRRLLAPYYLYVEAGG